MKDHFVICGWTPIAKVVFKELVSSGHNIAIVSEKLKDASEIKSMKGDLEVTIVQGDPSVEEMLKMANVGECHTAIVCTVDDTKNLIVSLHIKEMNPNARIIASIQREELKKTLKAAGVTYVASPDEMAGRLVASASFEPEVGAYHHHHD